MLTIGNSRDKIIVKESFPIIMELIKEARLNANIAKSSFSLAPLADQAVL